jgi:hypothetical protein
VTGEIDALRRVILYQVPITWEDALVLQFHIYIMHRLEDDPPKEDVEALTVGIETLFDFMACELDKGDLAFGRQLDTGAKLVFYRRRYRTGTMED